MNNVQAGAEACRIEGCKRPYRAKGYCTVHYRKWRHGELPHPRWKNVPPPSSAKATEGEKKEEVKQEAKEEVKKEAKVEEKPKEEAKEKSGAEAKEETKKQ